MQQVYFALKREKNDATLCSSTFFVGDSNAFEGIRLIGDFKGAAKCCRMHW